MKKRKQKDQPYMARLRRGTEVVTSEGPGCIVGHGMRRNDNGGPGCRQYVVLLHDGRTRHYDANGVVCSRAGRAKRGDGSEGARNPPAKAST